MQTSGEKRGPTDYGRLALRHPRDASERVIPFAALTTLRQLFVRLRARGYSLARSAEMAGVPLGTASRWDRSAWCRGAIRALQAEIVSDKVAALTQLLPDALDTLGRSLRGEPIEPESGANARYVIDHIYGKATVWSESHTRSEVATVTADDMMRAMDRLEGLGVAYEAWVPATNDAGHS